MNADMKATLIEHHYTHSVPSRKSWYHRHGDAIVVFSIPANRNISKWLVGAPNAVLELTRLWAPDGHDPNLLTAAISASIQELRPDWGGILALVSYADPNVGHSGGVYRAGSWTYLGQCEESRNYRDVSGRVYPRRKFHSGHRSLTKAEIEVLGYAEFKMPGKHRFARGLTKAARKVIQRKAARIRRDL